MRVPSRLPFHAENVPSCVVGLEWIARKESTIGRLELPPINVG